jgi:hypothetical protein
MERQQGKRDVGRASGSNGFSKVDASHPGVTAADRPDAGVRVGGKAKRPAATASGEPLSASGRPARV